MESHFSKIKPLAKQSHTVNSYDEVKMDLFVPKDGRTKNWYIRVYVPSDLKTLYGKTAEFRQSTRTTDKLEAQARAAQFIAQKSREFLEKRRLLARTGAPSKPSRVALEPNLIEHISSVRLANLVHYDDEFRDGQGDDDWPEHEYFVVSNLDDLNKIISQRKKAPAYKNFVTDMLDHAHVMGYEIAQDDPLFDDFVKAMARVEKRAFEIMSRRNVGEPVGLSEGEGGPWLSDVLKGWEQENTAHLDARTQQSYRSRIQSFIRFAKDKPASKVEQKDIFDWFMHLLHDDKLSRKTLTDGYFPALRSLMTYATSSGKYRIIRNPLINVTVPRLSKKDEKRRTLPRLPFTITYLNILFASDWYSGKSINAGRHSKTFTGGGARYWLPLIAMVQGLRPEEVCQMTLLDVGMQSGVMSLRVSDEGEGQRTKNISSKRWVPVHKILLNLGFASYVADQHKQQGIDEPEDEFRDRLPGEKISRPKNAGRLFPEVASSYKRQANAFGQLFNRYIHSNLNFETEYKFYSFRHLWEDRRREAMSAEATVGRSWPAGLHLQLSGRAPSARSAEEGSAADYGQGFTPKAMKPFLDKIAFPNLKLPIKWPEFERR